MDAKRILKLLIMAGIVLALMVSCATMKADESARKQAALEKAAATPTATIAIAPFCNTGTFYSDDFSRYFRASTPYTLTITEDGSQASSPTGTTGLDYDSTTRKLSGTALFQGTVRYHLTAANDYGSAEYTVNVYCYSRPPNVSSNSGGYEVTCRDGTISYSGGKRGACSHHGGES